MSAWSRLRTPRGRRNLALTAVGSTLSAVLGSVATAPDSAWYRALDKPPWQPPPIAVNLALNTGWNVVFWRLRRPWLATAWCAVLTGQSVLVARRLRDVDPALHAAWAPYPAWTAFATALNAAVARRNG